MVRMVMQPPWAVEIRDRAPLTVAVVMAGEAWVTSSAGGIHQLRAGQVGIVRGPDPYVFADRPETQPQVVVRPGQRCEDLSGRSLEQPLSQGVRTWGNDPDGSTVIVVGTYETIGGPGRVLLAELPVFGVVDRTQIAEPVVELLASEVASDAPGQGVVLDRLLDLLTVSALRSWFDQAGSGAPGWWRAGADPVVGTALRLLQNNPAHGWTVAGLAAEVGVSRAGLARQFTELVGMPPMTFLTQWRLALAADLLLEPDATVQRVAREVGYGSGFALSAAFKRVHGVSPTVHRQQSEAA